MDSSKILEDIFGEKFKTACVNIFEAGKTFTFGNEGLSNCKEAKESSKNALKEDGMVIVVKDDNSNKAEWIGKETLRTALGDENKDTSVLSMFFRIKNEGFKKIQELVQRKFEETSSNYETIKNGFKKVVILSAIVSAGLLGPQISEAHAQAQQVSTPFEISSEFPSPSSADIQKVMVMREFYTAIENAPIVSSIQNPYVNPEMEKVRKTLQEILGDESFVEIPSKGIDFDKFAKEQRNRFPLLSLDEDSLESFSSYQERKDFGEKFQKIYLELKKERENIDNILKKLPFDELKKLFFEFKNQEKGSGSPLFVRINNFKELSSALCVERVSGKIPLSGLLSLIAPEGHTITLSSEEVSLYTTLHVPRMNTKEERESYFEKNKISPDERERVLLIVDMLKALSQTQDAKKQQHIFFTYKKAELAQRCRQSFEFAVEDKKVDGVSTVVAVFAKDAATVEKVFSESKYAWLKTDNDAETVDVLLRLGEKRLGGRGFLEKLTADEILSVLNSIDMSSLKDKQISFLDNSQSKEGTDISKEKPLVKKAKTMKG